MGGRFMLLALAAAFGLAAGCLLSLDDTIACGDGYTDRAAGEQCDPLDRDSYIGACKELGDPSYLGSCNPDDCTIDATACFPRCGNGIIDQQEECDVAKIEDLAQPKPCTDLQPPLADFKNAYVGGESVACTLDTCMFRREGCHYCGDGVVDPDYQHYPELCDRNEIDKTALHDRCRKLCDLDGIVPDDAAIRCNVDCAPDCRDLVAGPNLACCLAPGETINDDILPCCFAPSPGDSTCPLRPI